MSLLYEEALKNPFLSFIDGETGKVKNLSDFDYFLPESANRALIFAYLDNSIESIEIFWQLIRSKHAIALLPPALSKELKESLEDLYCPKWIIDFDNIIREKYVVKSSFNIKFYEVIISKEFEIHPAIKLLLNTSGTTGSPKFVKLSESNLVSNAQSIAQYLPIKPTDITPLNLPIYYSYGLSVLTSNSLFGGKIFCSNDDILKKSFWSNFEKYGFSSFAGVPFVYEMLDRIGFTKKVYPSLKYFTQAGGKLQLPLVKKFANYALENEILFYVMYGQTEATARMSYMPPEFLTEKAGSIGKPIPGGSFFINIDNEELCYSGPNVFGGYVENLADLSTFDTGKVLCTGDTAEVDQDGFFFITGRLKRFVKIFGNRINLDEVESIIFNLFNISAKCIGVEDKHLVIFFTQQNIDEKNILTGLTSYLKIHISAIKTCFIEEVPLTNNGKVNYSQLYKLYELK